MTTITKLFSKGYMASDGSAAYIITAVIVLGIIAVLYYKYKNKKGE